MQIPCCKDVKIKCACCELPIEHDEEFEEANATIGIWKNGLVATVFGHFKSPYEGKAIILGLCITCMEKKLEREAAIILYDKYQMGELPIET